MKVLTPKQRGAVLLRRLAHPGREGEEVRVRRRRHRAAAPRDRGRGPRAPEALAHARRPLRRERLLRRRVRELVPRERPGRAQRARVRAVPPEREGLEVHPARRDRDVLHPRPQEAHDGAGVRARLPAELLQQLLRAHEGDGLARDGLHAHREGPARRAAPPVDRDRAQQDGQQPRRHEGRERADQRVRPEQGGDGRPAGATPSAAARPGSSGRSRPRSRATARPS